MSCTNMHKYANYLTNRMPNSVLGPQNIIVSNTDDGPRFELAWQGSTLPEVPIRPHRRGTENFILEHDIGFYLSNHGGLEAIRCSTDPAANTVRGSGDHEYCYQNNIHGPQSSDIWSLGCVFMEFARWCLGHSEFSEVCQGRRPSPGQASADSEYQDIHPEKDRVHWPPTWAANVSLADTAEAELTCKAKQNEDIFVLALLPIIKKMLKPPGERPSAVQVDTMLKGALSKTASGPRLQVQQVIERMHDWKRSRFIRKLGLTNSKDRASGRRELTESEYITAMDAMNDRDYVSPNNPEA